jgi:hypothetical protein
MKGLKHIQNSVVFMTTRDRRESWPIKFKEEHYSRVAEYRVRRGKFAPKVKKQEIEKCG